MRCRYGLFLLVLLLTAPVSGQDRFRILFGGHDAATGDWSGSLRSEGGAIRIVAQWHFRGEDVWRGDNTWQADNGWAGNTYLTPQDEHLFSRIRWKGVIADVTGGGQTRVHIETQQGNASFRAADVRYLEPVWLLDRRIKVERVPYTTELSDPATDDDYPAITTGPDGRIWTAWISWDGQLERILLRSSADGRTWSAPVNVTETRGEFYQVALAATQDGVTAVWSAITDGNVDLL